MKVDDRNLNGVAGAQTGRTTGTHETDRNTSAAGAHHNEYAGGDRADISGLAGRLSQALHTHSTERAQRIDALTKQYRAGQYHPTPQATSHALIQDALENKDGAA
jgi:hypothetical protein